MPRRLTWYFDVISPYAYLQTGDLHRLPADTEITPKLVLFEGEELRRHAELPLGAVRRI